MAIPRTQDWLNQQSLRPRPNHLTSGGPKSSWKRPSMAPDHLANPMNSIDVSLAGVDKTQCFNSFEAPGTRDREMARSKNRVKAIAGGRWQASNGRIFDLQETAVNFQVTYDDYTRQGGNAMTFAKRHPPSLKLQSWLDFLSCDVGSANERREIWPLAQQQLVKAGGLGLSMVQRRDKVLEVIRSTHWDAKLSESNVEKIAAGFWEINRELSEVKIMAKAYCDWFGVKKIILLDLAEVESIMGTSNSGSATSTKKVTHELRKEFMTSFTEWLQQTQALSVEDAKAKMKAIMQGDLDGQILDWIKNGKPTATKEQKQDLQQSAAIGTPLPELNMQQYGQGYQQPTPQYIQTRQQADPVSIAQQGPAQYGSGYGHSQQQVHQQSLGVPDQSYQYAGQPPAYQQVASYAAAQPGYEFSVGYGQQHGQGDSQMSYQHPVPYTQQDWQNQRASHSQQSEQRSYQQWSTPAADYTQYPTTAVQQQCTQYTPNQIASQISFTNSSTTSVSKKRSAYSETKTSTSTTQEVQELAGPMQQLQMSGQPSVEVQYPGWDYSMNPFTTDQQNRKKEKKRK